MSTQINKSEFHEIYNKTYNSILKFIAVKCQNVEDINDILQDTYTELYKILQKIDNKKIAYHTILKYNITTICLVFVITIVAKINSKYFMTKRTEEIPNQAEIAQDDIIKINNVDDKDYSKLYQYSVTYYTRSRR